jgi:hypothetical protein
LSLDLPLNSGLLGGFQDNGRSRHEVAQIYYPVSLQVLLRVVGGEPHPQVTGKVEVLSCRQGLVPFG